MEEAANWTADDVKYRDPTVVAVLNLVTLGIYWFYLVYVWSDETNRLLGRYKYPPGLMLLISILTCGLAGCVVECLIAADLGGEAAERQCWPPNQNLLAWVITLNISAFIAAAVLPLVGLFVSIPLGVAATVMVQIELNKFSRRNAAY
jgi:hypothetical protein